MRRQGASIFVYLIFGLLIAIFVLTINPSSGQGGGCAPASNTWLTVDGSRVHKNDYHIAYNNRWNDERGKDRVHHALEMLIQRELLAQAAADRGMRVPDDMVEEEIKKGYFYYGGLRQQMGPNIFDYQRTQLCEGATPPPECAKKCPLAAMQMMGMDLCGKGFVCSPDLETDDQSDMPMGTCDVRCTPEGNQCGPKETCTIDGRCALWNPNKFKSWLAQLNVSKKSYLSEQARNMQANMMLEVLVGSVRVAKEEAREAFIASKTTVTYDVVTFKEADYRKKIRLTEADVQRYLAAHEDEVKAKFKAEERTYKDVKPQIKLRRIVIAKAEPAAKPPEDPKKPDDKKPADAKKPDAKKPDDKKPAVKPVGMPIAEAKQKLEAARTAIAANKRKFVDVATELSTDETEKANGGALGWRPQDSAGLGDKILSDAVKALKPGEMTPVLETESGVHLILVEDKRPVGDAKDLTYDQVKYEIAEKLAIDAWSKEAAKRAALDAHADVVKSGKKLAQVFPREGAPMPGSEEMDLPPDLEEQLKEKGIKLAPPGGAPPPGAGSGSAAPPAPKSGSGSAAPKTGALIDESDESVEVIDTPVGWKYEGPDGSSAGSAAGSGSAGGTGSAAPPAPTPPAPTPTPPAPTIEPTKEQLPTFKDVEKPKVVSHGPEMRRASLPGVGKDLVTVLFEQLEPGKVAPRIYETPEGYAIVELTARGQPNLDEFDKQAYVLTRQMQLGRASSFVLEWLNTKCEALLKDNKIEPLQDLLADYDDKGNLLPATYRPCQEFKPRQQPPGF